MDNRIDVTNRKPRRLRGTPALKFITRTSLAVLGIGVGIGVFVTYQLPVLDKIKTKHHIDLINVSEIEAKRREIFKKSFVAQKSTDEIIQILKQKEQFESER